MNETIRMNKYREIEGLVDNVRLLLETAYDRGAKSREKDVVFVQEQDEARQQDKEELLWIGEGLKYAKKLPYVRVKVFRGRKYVPLEEVMVLICELERTWRKLNETDN